VSPKARRHAWIDWILEPRSLLICVVLASLALRLEISSNCSLWLDEAFTARDASRPWRDVLRGSQDHPPLLYVLTKIGVSLLGETEFGIRAASLTFGCFALLALYWLGIEIGLEARRAVLVVASFALAPLFVMSATEARHYAILMTCVTLALASCLAWLKHVGRWRYLLIFGASMTLAVLTQHFGLIYAGTALSVLVVGAVAEYARGRWAPTRSALMAHVGMLVGMVAVLFWSSTVASSVSGRYDPGETGVALEFNATLFEEIRRKFAWTASPVAWADYGQPLLASAGLALLARRARGRALAVLAVLSLPLIVLLFLKSRHFIVPRYGAPSFVLYHLASWLALFELADRLRRAVTSSFVQVRVAPRFALVVLAVPFFVRAAEYPRGYAAGRFHYRGLQSYFVDNLADDTVLVGFLGSVGSRVMRHYPVGTDIVNLETFEPVSGYSRYLIAEFHVGDRNPRRQKQLEKLVKKHFKVSARAWRELPLVELPATRYQPAVRARLVLLPEKLARQP
jgi:4-amino-4-deoxy-L-arabinose transferase-like glycosyltransferase